MTNSIISTKSEHPIGVAAERTGLTPDVLRVWERRYGAVSPKRSDGKQRLYSDQDIERLRLLRLATLPGRSISQVVRFTTEELARLVEEDTTARARVGLQETGSAQLAHDSVEQALALVREFDTIGIEWQLRRMAAVLGLTPFIETVAAPLLRRVGDEWHAGRLTTGQEHLTTALVRRVLSAAIPAMDAPADAPRLVVATPAGEQHEVGALFAAAAAIADGWRVTYLGADLPAREIARMAEATDARGVALSVVSPREYRPVLEEIRALRGQLPADRFLIVGGSAAANFAPDLKGTGVHVADRLPELQALKG
jgi:MerR family transcriptional regulator, light-induced transcriptional regulator